MGVNVMVWPRGTNRVFQAPTSGAGVQHVSDVGQLLSVTCSTRYEQGFGGHDLAEWKVKPFGGYLGGMFRPGDHVRITKGGGTLWEGEYSEAAPADDGTFTLNARGYAYNLSDYDSIYLKDNSAPTPDVNYPTNQLVGGDLITTWYGWDYATDQLGMPIAQVVGTLPTGAWGASPVAAQPVKVEPVLTALLLEQNLRWAVWGRSLVIDADPTTPLWAFDAPESLVGVADTDYCTHVYVWYVSTAPGDIPTDWSMQNAVDTEGIARFDVRTTTVDYRGAGLMTSTRASGIAASLLEQVKGRFIYSGSFTVSPTSGFRSAAGGTADIGFVRAGQSMKLNNVRTSQGQLMGEDNVIIGHTEYTYDATGGADGATESLQVTPMGAVARDLGTILQGKSVDAGTLLSAGSSS